MHRGFALVLIATALALSACDPGIGITVENRTDELVCFHERSGVRSCPDNVKPHDSVTWGVICTSDDTILVVLTVEGQQIYSNSATCGEWDDAGARIVVERANGDFQVTDSLGTR